MGDPSLLSPYGGGYGISSFNTIASGKKRGSFPLHGVAPI